MQNIYIFPHYSATSTPAHLTKKYVVYEDCLLMLFKTCHSCGDATTVTKHTIGTFLRLKQICTHCSSTYEWNSQPFLQNIPAGNLLLSAAILFCGALPSKVLHVLDTYRCATISKRTFYRHQKEYLQPSIYHVYKKHQSNLFSEIKKYRRGLVIGGDGRADSPGHSAKFGSYTVMELEKKAVIDIQLVQVSISAGVS